MTFSLSPFSAPSRPLVCVQGLGFVGAAMAAAVASAVDESGNPRFDVMGVDIATPEGSRRIAAINSGSFPFDTSDAKLSAAVQAARSRGNLAATSDLAAYEAAHIVIVDIHLDVTGSGLNAEVDFSGFRKAIGTIAERAPAGCLVIVETTVPPGTCAKIVAPELAAGLTRRGLPADSLLLAHSYERVMPGDHYFDSIVNYWRVYSGHDQRAAEACRAFLSAIINTQDYPLTQLHHTTASETAKVLENSYRATTIAFMEEWGRFAEQAGFDLFSVVDAIRKRPTHTNMRTPGFGVGGYCLTKDPLLALVGARDLLGLDGHDFPFCRAAVEANRIMPLHTLHRLDAILGGLAGRRILLAGISYRPAVADTRFSPSQTMVEAARAAGAEILCHDPLVGFWDEMGEEVPAALPAADCLDAVVMAVGHAEYATLDFSAWLKDARPLFFDANGVLGEAQRNALRQLGCRVESIGRGEGL